MAWEPNSARLTKRASSACGFTGRLQLGGLHAKGRLSFLDRWAGAARLLFFFFFLLLASFPPLLLPSGGGLVRRPWWRQRSGSGSSARRCRGGEVIPRPMARSKLRLGARTRPRGGIRPERRLGGELGRGRCKARGKAWSRLSFGAISRLWWRRRGPSSPGGGSEAALGLRRGGVEAAR